MELGGSIAVQSRMAFQGEYFVERYGAEAAENAPPITKRPIGGSQMQAIINGVSVTGTPQEIAEYQRIVADEKKKQSQEWMLWHSYSKLPKW